MEEIHTHHHHHHHHSHSHANEGHQAATSAQGAVNTTGAVVTEHHQQQQTITQPIVTISKEAVNTSTNQTSAAVQPISSSHSAASMDSSVEMAKYFPNAQTPVLTLPRPQQAAVQGLVQSTATSNTTVTQPTNTVNAGPYIPVSAPTAVQRFPPPVRPPFMTQQQRPVRPPGPPQLPPGIPSHSSQIEGLSVSQALVNDVLVDLQTKVINETVQQYQDESSSGTYLEPLPPIYIRAPQPTIILRSDLNRLRAELASRVRPPVVYRHPGGANQFQQHRFQQNTYQAPRFPAPPPQHFNSAGPYGGYQNAVFAKR